MEKAKWNSLSTLTSLVPLRCVSPDGEKHLVFAAASMALPQMFRHSEIESERGKR